MAGDLARADQGLFSKIYCHKRDINLSRTSVCSVYHVLRKCTRCDRAAYLHRARPGGIGHRRYLKGYDCGPNSIVRNNEERSWAPRRFTWYRATWPTSPPRPIALSHRITYVPCRAAMAPWLLRYPMCPKRALQFWPPSHWLVATVVWLFHQYFVPKIIFFRPKRVGPR